MGPRPLIALAAVLCACSSNPGGSSSTSGGAGTSAMGSTGGSTASSGSATTGSNGDGGPCPDGSLCALPDGSASLCCRGGCPDYAVDPQNCGACGVTCGANQACVGGYCIVQSCAGLAPFSSAEGQGEAFGPGPGCVVLGATTATGICCNGSCVADDLIFTDGNCGGCGLVCPAGSTCQAASCTLQSGEPASCTDASCGAGQACVLGSHGAVCVPAACSGAADDSLCALPGGAPGICCGGACVDFRFDPGNCLGCGLACAAGLVCEQGACEAPSACSDSTIGAPCVRDGGAGGTCCGESCVCVEGDPENCGACGAACPVGAACVLGICVDPAGFAPMACDLFDDAGPACGAGRACVPDIDPSCLSIGCGDGGGSCVNGICCGGSCDDVFADPQNCGRCGVACPSGVCAEGTCLPDPVPTACPQGCQPPSVCLGGICVPPHCAGSPFCQLDGGVGLCCEDVGCIDFAHDPDNCGGCGVRCPDGQSCARGVCSGTDTSCGAAGTFCGLDAGFSPFRVCCPGAGCTDLLSDARHCGDCQQDCTALIDGGRCVEASCVGP